MTATIAMPCSLNGETRLHLIVGDPVGQTKSPSGLTREFAARDVNAVCVPVHVASAYFDGFMRAAKRVHNVDGIVVTMPHKLAALRHCDEASERARLLGAVNLLHRSAERGWRGDMTDGIAMVTALRRAGCEPGGRAALLVGAGGAGSAMALALIEARVATLAVFDIDPRRRDDLVSRLGARAPVEVVVDAPDASGFDLIVNATPAGMRPSDPLPVDTTRLDPHAVVADFVTGPAMTPLLEAASGRGCKVVTGDDMFAVQAVIMADILLAPP